MQKLHQFHHSFNISSAGVKLFDFKTIRFCKATKFKYFKVIFFIELKSNFIWRVKIKILYTGKESICRALPVLKYCQVNKFTNKCWENNI